MRKKWKILEEKKHNRKGRRKKINCGVIVKPKANNIQQFRKSLILKSGLNRIIRFEELLGQWVRTVGGGIKKISEVWGGGGNDGENLES